MHVQATSNPSIPAVARAGFFTPRNINRILLVLGFIGIFDASLLSGEVLFKLNLSCGAEGGCHAVASHPSAYWFGYPVAYFGLAAYVAFTVLAAIRAFMGPATPKVLTYAGLGMGVFGALTSIYLQYMSLAVIGAFCPYCFGSAVNMVLTMVLYAMLASKVASLPAYVPPAEPVSSTNRSTDAAWVGVGTIATFVAVLVGGNTLQSQKKPPTIVPLTTDLTRLRPLSNDVHGYGDPNAPLKITEFADLACIHCQMLTPKLHQFIDEHPGKVYAIWRHFPLRQIHPMAITAALISEYAASKGKFWQYADKIFAIGDEPKTWEQVSEPATAIGLNLNDLSKEIQDENGPEMVAVQKDLADADYFGIHETPTFYIEMAGQSTRIANAGDVFDVLSAPPYKDFLNKK